MFSVTPRPEFLLSWITVLSWEFWERWRKEVPSLVGEEVSWAALLAEDASTSAGPLAVKLQWGMMAGHLLPAMGARRKGF